MIGFSIQKKCRNGKSIPAKTEFFSVSQSFFGKIRDFLVKSPVTGRTTRTG